MSASQMQKIRGFGHLHISECCPIVNNANSPIGWANCDCLPSSVGSGRLWREWPPRVCWDNEWSRGSCHGRSLPGKQWRQIDSHWDMNKHVIWVQVHLQWKKQKIKFDISTHKMPPILQDSCGTSSFSTTQRVPGAVGRLRWRWCRSHRTCQCQHRSPGTSQHRSVLHSSRPKLRQWIGGSQ